MAMASGLLLAVQALSAPASRHVPGSPSTADRFFDRQTRHAHYAALIGFGPLWHSSTGLNDGDRASGDEIATGIELSDARLIRTLRECLRFTDQHQQRLYSKYKDSIIVSFCSVPPRREGGVIPWWIENGVCDVICYHDSGKDYGVVMPPMQTAQVMASGSGPRLRAFVRRMARRARAHGQGVSYFYYYPQSLEPS